MLEEQNREKRDKPIRPGHFELSYQSSLKRLLADISIKLKSFFLKVEVSIGLESN